MAAGERFMLKRLSEWGVDWIYGYPGDGINGVLGALARPQERFELSRCPPAEAPRPSDARERP